MPRPASMERGSASRRSWADEVEEEELPGGSLHPAPPAAAFDPSAVPLSASGSPALFDWGERLSFYDSEESDGSDGASPEPPAASSIGKAVAAVGRRRRGPRRRRAGVAAGAGFMEAARRSHPTLVPRHRPSHPARASGPPDADGYHQVQSRKR
jgi:hypothetical protein